MKDCFAPCKFGKDTLLVPRIRTHAYDDASARSFAAWVLNLVENWRQNISMNGLCYLYELHALFHLPIQSVYTHMPSPRSNVFPNVSPLLCNCAHHPAPGRVGEIAKAPLAFLRGELARLQGQGATFLAEKPKA